MKRGIFIGPLQGVKFGSKVINQVAFTRCLGVDYLFSSLSVHLNFIIKCTLKLYIKIVHLMMKINNQHLNVW